MSFRTQISQSFSSIILFMKLFKTYQIGQLSNICSNLIKDPTLYDNKILSRLLIHFITHVNDENRKTHREDEHLAIVITQSLIYNLFIGNCKNQLNNSIYSNSLMNSSNSHIAFSQHSNINKKNYQSIDQQLSTKYFNFLLDFITDPELQKKIKLMIDRGFIKAGQESYNKNQRYIDILLETIEYIMKKYDKYQRNYSFENFQISIANKNSQSINSHYEKKNLKIVIGEVNKIIFSGKLNRIALVLSEADQKLYYSLLRIYFGEVADEDGRKGKNAKYYTHIEYNGEEMIFNLIFAYIESIPTKSQLFQSSKNPLYLLIQSYLLCFYLPTFRNFNSIIAKCCKYDYHSGIEFYKICQNTINKNVITFIQELPNDLIEYLRKIYKIILISEYRQVKKQMSTNMTSIALIAVKKLLIYSLLVRPILIQSYYSQGIDLQKYQQVCNNLINLFFKSSLKKFQNLDSEQFQKATQLTKIISNKLQEKIIGNFQVSSSEQAVYFQEFQELGGVKNYIIQQPMLNNDYEILWEQIKIMEFTPKDLKQFQMKKTSQLQLLFTSSNPLIKTIVSSNQTPMINLFSPRQAAIQSPMNKTKKDTLDDGVENNQYESENRRNQFDVGQKEEIDFLTWMAIGGNKNYYQENSWNCFKDGESQGRSQRKIRMNFQVETFSKDKIREINRLYEKYENLLL